MRFGKKPDESNQGRNRRRLQSEGETIGERRPQAFSYYANRTPEGSPENREERRPGSPRMPGQELVRHHLQIGRLPYILLLIVLMVCAIKVMALNTNPKIIIIEGSNVTKDYTEPTATYQQAASAYLKGSITNRSKLTIDTSSVAAKLKTHFPELHEVSLTIPLVGNRPIIYIMPEQPIAALQTGGANYALGSTGAVLTKLSGIPDGLVPLHDESGGVPRIGQQILPSSTMSFISTVKGQLTAAKQTIVSLTLPGTSAYELDVKLSREGYMIRFNLQADAAQQTGALLAVQQKLGTAQPTSYIDVRVPERVYYK